MIKAQGWDDHKCHKNLPNMTIGTFIEVSAVPSNSFLLRINASRCLFIIPYKTTIGAQITYNLRSDRILVTPAGLKPATLRTGI